MLLLSLTATALASPCRALLAPTPHSQPDGPRCLAGAVATAMSLTEAETTPTALAREVKVTPAGIDPFDIQLAGEALGAQSLVFTGPPEAAARLVEAGFAPVALVSRSGNARHAVTVTGAERGVDESGQCTTALKALQVYDPLTDRQSWLTAQAFANLQSAQQLMVFFDEHQRETLDDRGFPVDAAIQVDRRFRARGWLRRAEAHPKPNAQSVRLLERAVAADPDWPVAASALSAHRQHLGESP